MASHSLSKSRVLAVPLALHPLTKKHFGFFWAGAFLSSIGFWIQTVGQGWQVLQLSAPEELRGRVVSIWVLVGSGLAPSATSSRAGPPNPPARPSPSPSAAVCAR